MTKKTKQHIRQMNEMLIEPMIHQDDFLRLNILNYARSEFRNEAQKLKPIGTGPTDFTNIYNMSVAWDYVLKNLNETITASHIRTINSVISQNNIELTLGGIFRHGMSYVFGEPAPNPEKIYNLMDNAIYKMNSDKNLILTRAFDIHYDIITIQPFCDFNKRTARIVMNWFLLQNKYTPILFNHKSDNQDYASALRARLHGDTKTYTNYMCDRMCKTQHAILQMLYQRTK